MIDSGNPGDARRRRKVVSALVAGVLAAGAMFIGAAPSARADSIVSEQVLYQVKDNPNTPSYDERNVRVSNPYDPTCNHIPGIVRGGKVWVDTYVSDSLGRYNGLKWEFWTTYRKTVAVAKQSWKDQYGTQPSCAFLNTFDNKGELPALRAMTCQNPYANVSIRPNRWCALEARLDSGLAVPHTVDLHTEDCQQPQWNGGKWGGPNGWAAWHNQHVKLDTTDILKELGLDWIPGHFNIDTYAEDFEMLSGVSNFNPSTFQPSDASGRWLGYGQVQTAAASELWVRFFDAVARAKGVDPVANPIKAHDTTAPNAIANNALLTINLWPDVPSKSQWITVRVGDYRQQLFQVICAWSPKVKDVLGDTNGGRLVIPAIPGVLPAPCDLGFSAYAPQSAAGNGLSFLEFTRVYSPDDAKDLKGHEVQFAQIMQEMFNNRDTVNPMLIQSPFDTDASGNTVIRCHVEDNLGVSRGTHYNSDGSLNVDMRDPHFVHRFRG
jgi:hypothetical protein